MATAELTEIEHRVLQAIARLERSRYAPSTHGVAGLVGGTYVTVRPVVNELMQKRLITPGLGLTDAGREALEAVP